MLAKRLWSAIYINNIYEINNNVIKEWKVLATIKYRNSTFNMTLDHERTQYIG